MARRAMRITIKFVVRAPNKRFPRGCEEFCHASIVTSASRLLVHIEITLQEMLLYRMFGSILLAFSLQLRQVNSSLGLKTRSLFTDLAVALSSSAVGLTPIALSGVYSYTTLCNPQEIHNFCSAISPNH
jgi:hypothetical protein